MKLSSILLALWGLGAWFAPSGADAMIGAVVGGEYPVAFDPPSPDGTDNGTAGCGIRERCLGFGPTRCKRGESA